MQEDKGKQEVEIDLGGVPEAPFGADFNPEPLGGGGRRDAGLRAPRGVPYGTFRNIKNTNSLFGMVVGRTNKGKIVINTNRVSKGAINDYVMRETGLEKELQRSLRLGVALHKPEDYLQAKAEDLDKVGARLSAYFAAEYSRLLQTGITQEKAREKATAYMHVQKEREMAIHNANWPTEINEKVTEKLLRTKSL